MSELSEALKATMTAVSEESGGRVEGSEDTFVPADEELDKILGNVPFTTEIRKYHGTRGLARVHRSYRRRVGNDPFPDHKVAYEELENEMIQTFTEMMFLVMADGIQYGQANSFPYKKYRTLGKLDKAMENKAWRDESAMIAMPYLADQDCFDLAKGYLYHTISNLLSASGYAQGMHETHKIYDLWFMASTSVTIASYLVGYRIGSTHAETDVLSGILAATEATDE